ncbi:MAG: SUMF1/EgtB/PvdO family nonheme iron enzyme [Calditrichaeota bacterium]|nr:SUMF1/EgtB/PvdO family nonheme iron enzyme [Calditrichota bacterium]
MPAGKVLIESEGRSFVLGSSAGFEDEIPEHTVTLTKSFWIDTVETTQGLYDVTMSASYPGYATPTWFAPYGVGDIYPAYHVYWGDAVLFCNALSRRDGLDSVYTYTSIVGTPGNLSELEGVVADFSRNGYRLPTEAEWEYACMGGESHDFYWGKDLDPYPATPIDSAEIGDFAVWYSNSYELGASSSAFGSQPVGTRVPNGYGLYDMSGNLYEWCHDWYGPYGPDAVTDPAGPSGGDYHVLRGGSWGSNAEFLRSSNRTFSVPDYLYYFIGFRTVVPKQ